LFNNLFLVVLYSLIELHTEQFKIAVPIYSLPTLTEITMDYQTLQLLSSDAIDAQNQNRPSTSVPAFLKKLRNLIDDPKNEKLISWDEVISLPFVNIIAMYTFSYQNIDFTEIY